MKAFKNKIFKQNLINDTLSTAVVVLDKSLSIVGMNLAAENLFGQSRNQFIDKSYSLLFKNSDIHKYLSLILDKEESQSLRSFDLNGRYNTKLKVDFLANPFFIQNQLEGIVLELYRIDHQIRVAREEHLLIQQEATQVLLRGLAHEIKNPLGGLRGAAQLLEGELENNDLKEYTQIIISEADRLQNLVDRMLGSNQPTEPVAVNIHEVLERVRKLVRADTPKGVNLRFDYDPSIPNIHADQDSLIQVIFNIVGNALKAVGDKGNILFKTRIVRNYSINHIQHRLVMRLDIIDDGVGVPERIKNKLFYPMVSGSAEGTGLGLSIAQSLANQHKGVIEFESKQNETRFILLLPIPEES